MTDLWEVMPYSPDNFNYVVNINIPGGLGKYPKFLGRNKNYLSNFKTYLDSGEIIYERLDDAVERFYHLCLN